MRELQIVNKSLTKFVSNLLTKLVLFKVMNQML